MSDWPTQDAAEAWLKTTLGRRTVEDAKCHPNSTRVEDALKRAFRAGAGWERQGGENAMKAAGQ